MFKGEGGMPGGVLRGGGSAVRFHDCTNNAAMTQMRDLKDMVSTSFAGYLKNHSIFQNRQSDLKTPE